MALEVVAEEHPDATSIETDRRVGEMVAAFSDGGPPSEARLVLEEIEGVPVVMADEVARYFESLRVRIGQIQDLTAAMVPPYPLMWVEAQNVPNAFGAHAWGAIVARVPPEAAGPDVAEYMPRWLLHLSLVVEWRRGHPVGPAC
jgi:hypothetical protein